MPRYATYSEPDTVQVNEGDRFLLGVNDKTSPENLTEGLCSEAVNKRFRTGAARTRKGVVTPVFADIGTGAVYGSGLFSDPNGIEWMFLARSSGCYRIRWDNSPKLINLDTGESISTTTEFVQALDKLLIFRGPDDAPLQYDPASETTGSFAAFDAATGGKTAIPNAQTAELLKNRIWVPHDDDSIAASDVLDYKQYDATLNLYRVNAGEDDKIIRIFPFTQDSMLVFKEQSTYLISNIYADPTSGEISDSIRIDLISSAIGCAARKSVAMVGKDVFFLTTQGVFSISQEIVGLVQTQQQPVSDPISSTIRRINWAYASAAVATVHEEYFYLAVPLDTSTVNDTILVFNARTGYWEGYHQFPSGVQLDNLLVSDWLDRKEVYGINHSNGDVYLLYFGEEDRINGTISQISDSVTSRAYLMGDNEIKAFRRARVAAKTFNGQLTVELITDGVNESVTLEADRTFDRTKYYTWAKADYDATNTNDDHASRDREDYSPTLGTPFYLKTNGIDAPLLQSKIFSYPTKQRARWATVKVSNEQGICEVTSIGVEGFVTQRAVRVKN